MEGPTVVLVSGGMDSATLLAKLIDQLTPVEALTIHYGQRHSREVAFAREFCHTYGIGHTVCDLGAIRPLLAGSSQTDAIKVPMGHYADPVMRVTVVPNRNMILLAVAAAFAIGKGGKAVAYAAHAGDHAVYPDCRPEFMQAISGALRLCHYDGGIELLTPFAYSSKADIAVLGRHLRVPYELTYSCYEGRTLHCGRCGTCVERRLAFQEAGFTDPAEYECSMDETLAVMQK